DVPDEAVTDTEEHLNAPALVVRADCVQATLRTLRDDLTLDHLACVTGQAYGDRHESIYHLRAFDDPTRELSVVVPAPVTDPTSESGAPVFAGADWHEREAYDLVGIRYDDPYGYYDRLDWDVVTEDGGDNFARVLVRLRELEQSARIVEQCLNLLEDWPEDDRTIQANVPRTLRPDPDTEVYRAVEAAKGELGIYIRSDGTDKPARFKIRGPSFSNRATLPAIARGECVPDLIASLGSLDTIMGEVDR
ncbi:MAG: NADH-quinone oxidoreductase subunit C, partial [Haloarculaceae archaeon]